MDPKCDVAAEDFEKREDLDEIWPTNEPHFLLIKEANKVVYGWKH
jgi:hypothetical protein